MGPTIIIRPMALAEIDVVTDIYAEGLSSSYISFSELAEGKADGIDRLAAGAAEIFRSQLISLHESRSHAFFVAVVDEPVGFVLASLHQTEAGHLECWLDDIGVRRAWRRKGLAQSLIKEVFAWGRRTGAKYYLLESGVGNHTAHELFTQSGFRPLATVFCREQEK